ncbi:hypothetical protein [Spirillospora sp. NBC_01491]|uniref:hypothetical protein n=1 Tax=Spirillospora sp. NBC_01491 TaxID=2976007 RepID=UPI002E34A8D0|nr:hypothetical protein [Spirillospora sp. NBC_01491]
MVEDGADPLPLLRLKHRGALAGAAIAVTVGIAVTVAADGESGAQYNLGLAALIVGICIGVYAGTLDIALTTLRSIAVQHDEQDRATAGLAERLDSVEMRERQMAARIGDLFADELAHRRRSG